MSPRRAAAGRRAALTGALLASVGLALAVSSPASAPGPGSTPTPASTSTTPHAPKPPRAPKPPLASTGGASDVSYSSAALTGTVNPHGTETSYYFQYGLTTAYGAQTPTVVAGSGTLGVKVRQPVSGLQLGAAYHYRLVAVSSAGPANGPDRTFTTKQVPLKFVIAPATTPDVYGSPFTVTGTLTGSGAANHQVILQANTFPYLGSFTNVGTPVSTNAQGGFSFRAPGISQTTQLRVGTLDALPIYSRVVTEHVAVLVTLRAHPTRSRGLVRLEGTVEPAEVGAPVVFQHLRATHGPAGTGSTVVRRGTASVSRFSAVVSIHRSGQYRALVKVSNGKQVSGSSPTVFLHAPPVVHRAHRHPPHP